MSAQPGIQDDDGTFNRQVLDEIEEAVEQRAQEELGENVDLSQGSPIKQLLDVAIYEHEYTWQVLEDVYYAAYYGHAYEDQLDSLLALTQFQRLQRRGATGEVEFATRVANDERVNIPEGTEVATRETDDRPSIPFRTTEPAYLPAGSGATGGVPVRSCTPWECDVDVEWLGVETNVAAETITKFITPIEGVDTVTNPRPTGAASREQGYAYIEGRDRETDAEFRRRFEQQLGADAAASLDALRASALQLSGIRNADIEENTSMNDLTENGGLPPKSFRLTVLGGAHNDDIAQMITDTRSAGIESYGDATGESVTDDGEIREESFDWANEIGVYIEIDVTHDDNYPHDGNLRVENNVIDHIGGEDASGTTHPGLGMGEDVIYDLVHNEAMKVPGVWRVDVYLGAVPNPTGTSDIEIETLDTAMTSHDDVAIFNTVEERP